MIEPEYLLLSNGGKLLLLKIQGMKKNLTDDKSGKQAGWITIGTIGLFFFIFGFVTWLNGILNTLPEDFM